MESQERLLSSVPDEHDRLRDLDSCLLSFSFSCHASRAACACASCSPRPRLPKKPELALALPLGRGGLAILSRKGRAEGSPRCFYAFSAELRSMNRSATTGPGTPAAIVATNLFPSASSPGLVGESGVSRAFLPALRSRWRELTRMPLRERLCKQWRACMHTRKG